MRNQCPWMNRLKAQYQLAKVGVARGSTVVTDPGTVLKVMKGGILARPPTSVALCPVKFEGGTLKSPSSFGVAMVHNSASRYLQSGEKVYASKIDVALDRKSVV